jgi:hypothetical protein
MATIAPDAEAGWFNKSNSERDSEKKLTPRYDNFPTMSFHLGTLVRNGYAGWKLGELDVQISPQCIVQSNGEDDGVLVEGRQAIVSGAQVGNTIMALRVTILKPNWDMGPENYDEDVIWSDADPTVGVGHGPS